MAYKLLKNYCFFTLFLLFASSSSLFAQTITISGIVVDSISKEPLPFVNIMVVGDNYTGAISDIDGHFKIVVTAKHEKLRINFVGYHDLIIQIDSLPKRSNLKIGLSPSTLNYNDVVIVAGENPAYRIIKSAIKKRKDNNPEKLKKFHYRSYNKALLFNEYNKPKASDSLLTNGVNFYTSLSMIDSIGPSSKELPFYFMLMESVTERSFKAPDKDQEIVLGTRVSGFQHPSFAHLATAVQPFSFYKDLIIILDKEFINPIAPGSINLYEFRLEDTLYQQYPERSTLDSIFVISFFPRKTKNFDALKGILYISSNNYAVQYVLAEPANKSLIDLKFEQKYDWINNEQWFPVQLNFELLFSPNEGAEFTFQGKSYLSDINLHPDYLKNRNFGLNNIDLAKGADKREEDFWQKYRNQELTTKELNTYQFIDSLGKAIKMDQILSFSQELPKGMLPIGPLNLDLRKLLNYNAFEKFRLGLGLYSGSKISKRLIFGGYFGYGFGDKKWKYGADFIAHIAPKRDISMELFYRNDIAEPAPLFDKTGLLSTYTTPVETFARKFVLNRMDYQERLELGIHFRVFRHIQLHPFINATEIRPGYDYQFMNEEGLQMSQFRLVQAGVQARIAYKEKYADFNGQRTKLEDSPWPTLFISYIQGLNVPSFGEVVYKKVTAGLESNFFIKRFGRTRIDIQGGWIDRAVPFSLLFNGRGSKNGILSLFNRSTFQTMGLTEFYSDRFVYGFLTHNFGPLPIKSKIFRPEPRISQAVGFGSLSAPSRHSLVDFKTMEHGFYESGLMFDNVFRMKMANVAYLGFGVGVFYRYGPYHLNKGIDNWAFKFGLTATL